MKKIAKTMMLMAGAFAITGACACMYEKKCDVSKKFKAYLEN